MNIEVKLPEDEREEYDLERDNLAFRHTHPSSEHFPVTENIPDILDDEVAKRWEYKVRTSDNSHERDFYNYMLRLRRMAYEVRAKRKR